MGLISLRAMYCTVDFYSRSTIAATVTWIDSVNPNAVTVLHAVLVVNCPTTTGSTMRGYDASSELRSVPSPLAVSSPHPNHYHHSLYFQQDQTIY